MHHIRTMTYVILFSLFIAPIQSLFAGRGTRTPSETPRVRGKSVQKIEKAHKFTQHQEHLFRAVSIIMEEVEDRKNALAEKNFNSLRSDVDLRSDGELSADSSSDTESECVTGGLSFFDDCEKYKRHIWRAYKLKLRSDTETMSAKDVAKAKKTFALIQPLIDKWGS